MRNNQIRIQNTRTTTAMVIVSVNEVPTNLVRVRKSVTFYNTYKEKANSLQIFNIKLYRIAEPFKEGSAFN